MPNVPNTPRLRNHKLLAPGATADEGTCVGWWNLVKTCLSPAYKDAGVDEL